MKIESLTPWFPETVNPVRDGVYLTRSIKTPPHGGVYRRWESGSWWANGGKDVDEAAMADWKSSAKCEWRGLAKEQQS